MSRKNPGGRPPVLDENKRQQIIALLSLGCSRRKAAKFVGCSALTIARTAQRDPEFAAAMNRAEMNLEIESLRNLRAAASDPRYWRASAWSLERRNPDDFGPRPPNLLTYESLSQFIVYATRPFVKVLPNKNYDQLMQELEILADREPLPGVEIPQPIWPSDAPTGDVHFATSLDLEALADEDESLDCCSPETEPGDCSQFDIHGDEHVLSTECAGAEGFDIMPAAGGSFEAIPSPPVVPNDASLATEIVVTSALATPFFDTASIVP